MSRYFLTEEEILNILNKVNFLIFINYEKNSFDYVVNIDIFNIRRFQNNLKELYSLENIFNNNIMKIMDEEKTKILKNIPDIKKEKSFDIQILFIEKYLNKLEDIKKIIMNELGFTKNNSPIDLLSRSR